jgi:hypothetical protein
MYRHRTDTTATALVVDEQHTNHESSFLTLHGIRQGNVYIAFVDIEAVRFPQILRSHVSQEHVL